jgi:DNA-binding response OmpR family regulator
VRIAAGEAWSDRERLWNDVEASEVRFADVPLALTKGEYAMLLAFLEAPQRPLSREHLLQATRVHEDVFDRSMDVQILRLRRKPNAIPSRRV